MQLRKYILTFFAMTGIVPATYLGGTPPAHLSDRSEATVVSGDVRIGIGAEVCTPDVPFYSFDADNLDDEINDALFSVPTLEELISETHRAESWLARRQGTSMVDYAKNFIGTRYRRGAKGPKAFDCSGFTSYVFRKFGYSLSPASHLQGTQGQKIKLDEAQPGDLIFFSGRRAGSRIGHVGMVVEAGDGKVRFIHASTSQGVRIDSYPDGGYYSRRFIGVRRVIGQE